MTKYASQAPIEFTGYTKQGDELVEWRDDEVPQHAVAINREWRGLPAIAFHFAAQPEAHALFMALCEAEAIMVEADLSVDLAGAADEDAAVEQRKAKEYAEWLRKRGQGDASAS